VNSQNIFLKFCTTCKIVKDVRVFHCKYCNLCIERHDHHCPWLSNCIGERNHRIFFFSILVLCIHTAIIFSEQLYLVTKAFQDKSSFQLFDKIAIISLLTVSSVAFVFLVVLLMNQLYFIFKAITTSEFKRNKYGTGVFPFDKGSCRNLIDFFFDINSYKKDITYNIMADQYLTENSFVQQENIEVVAKKLDTKEDLSSLEMSFNTMPSKNQ